MLKRGKSRMYAIIREGDGQFYTSMVFGYYRSSDKSDYKNRFWIVLNKEKNALIKQHVFKQNTKYLIPMVLITDADETAWNKLSENEESVDFLPTGELLPLIDSNCVPDELTRKCIDMDSAYRFESLRAIESINDIRDLMCVSGDFHDAFIAEKKELDNSLYILFDGVWGCKIEVWFEGEVAYDTSCRDSGKYDPYWSSSTVTVEDGFVYLIDDENVSVSDLDSSFCWFKARSMKYRVIPN